MARQTRAERRARRQQATRAGARRGGQRRRRASRRSHSRPSRPSQPERGKPADQRARRRERHLRHLGRFVGESCGELRKTEWPSQNHVIQGTVVVLIACVIMGTFIWVATSRPSTSSQDVLLR